MPRSLDTALFLLAVTVALGSFLWLSNVSPADWNRLLSALAPPDTVRSDEGAGRAGASSRSQDGPRRAPWADARPLGSSSGNSLLRGDALGGDALALRTRSRRPSVPLPDPGPPPALTPAPRGGSASRPVSPSPSVRPRSVAPSARATSPHPTVRRKHRNHQKPWTRELERLGGQLNQIGTQVAALRRERHRDRGVAPQATDEASDSPSAAASQALGPFNQDDTGPLPGETPDPVPVDGGLGLLLVAGGAYGIRRLRRS